MSRRSQVIVLAEDARQQQFVRRYLYRLGYLNHEIDFMPLSEGRGSGEQAVRRDYPDAVYRFRLIAVHPRTALVVAIDADTDDVNRRQRQLEAELKLAGSAPRTLNEAIVHLVPRRNIESWILCLNGSSVNEDEDHSGRDVDDQVRSAAETFYDWSRRNAQIPDRCVPSLRAGIEEIRRLG